jgi:tight adherence protein B
VRLLAALSSAVFAYLVMAHVVGLAPNPTTRTVRRPQVSRRQLWLLQAGSDLTPRQFWVGSIGAGLGAFLAFLVLAGTWWVASIPAVAVSFAPYLQYGRQRTRRLAEVQRSWPDGLREILAHVNSGATLATGIEALADRGPAPLREAFARFPMQARMLGVVPALEIIKEELADPSSDKVVEVLVLAHQHGGETLQVVLRDLIETMVADQLTAEQIRTAGLEQRLESIVVAVAPWVILLFLATVPEAYREFYRSPQGRFVVLLAGVWAVVGWVLLRVISRRVEEVRVFGGGSILTAERDKAAAR